MTTTKSISEQAIKTPSPAKAKRDRKKKETWPIYFITFAFGDKTLAVTPQSDKTVLIALVQEQYEEEVLQPILPLANARAIHVIADKDNNINEQQKKVIWNWISKAKKDNFSIAFCCFSSELTESYKELALSEGFILTPGLIQKPAEPYKEIATLADQKAD